jgi:hypothetical protein
MMGETQSFSLTDSDRRDFGLCVQSLPNRDDKEDLVVRWLVACVRNCVRLCSVSHSRPAIS